VQGVGAVLQAFDEIGQTTNNATTQLFNKRQKHPKRSLFINLKISSWCRLTELKLRKENEDTGGNYSTGISLLFWISHTSNIVHRPSGTFP
jgi:hypothetical protein